jgi:hypothetical protein
MTLSNVKLGKQKKPDFSPNKHRGMKLKRKKYKIKIKIATKRIMTKLKPIH